MNDLLNITHRQIGGTAVQAVSARDLHRALELGKDFTTWIKQQIERARLKENKDWVLPLLGVNPSGGRPQHDYLVTVDAAKHIAMLSGTDRGFEVREYFIECERRARAAAHSPAIPQTLPEALRLAADLAEQKAVAEAALALAAPKVEAFDRIASATDGAVCLRVAAKLLQIPEKQFLRFASEKGFIFRAHGSGTWQGYSEKAKAGLLELKLTTVRRDDGSEKTIEQVLITRPGVAKLAALLGKEAA